MSIQFNEGEPLVYPVSFRELYSFRRPLLLQGPIGPFFSHLSYFLSSLGANVYKINFNAGDKFFYRQSADDYVGCPEDFQSWIIDYLRINNIDVVVFFGEYRNMHISARRAAELLSIPVFVFEEGYIRPHYSTLECHGVNANSLLPQTPDFYFAFSGKVKKPVPVQGSYFTVVMLCVRYYLLSWFFSVRFPHYQHHRGFNPFGEGIRWLGSWVRKCVSKISDYKIERFLVGEGSQKYFLVPLQTHSDAQITYHSDYESVEHFITEVVETFAAVAESEQTLVFKHHPMDRAYTNYKKLLKELEKRHALKGRILYIDECKLPELLDHAAGIVVVNSTVGLSGLQHKRPVKVMGRAIYNMEGLADQQPLVDFFKSPCLPDLDLVEKFTSTLIAQNQLNFNFYKPASYGAVFPYAVGKTKKNKECLLYRSVELISESK